MAEVRSHHEHGLTVLRVLVVAATLKFIYLRPPQMRRYVHVFLSILGLLRSCNNHPSSTVSPFALSILSSYTWISFLLFWIIVISVIRLVARFLLLATPLSIIARCTISLTIPLYSEIPVLFLLFHDIISSFLERWQGNLLSLEVERWDDPVINIVIILGFKFEFGNFFIFH